MPNPAHPLDNPIWESLSSGHAGVAVSVDRAARYPPSFLPFAAVPSVDPACANSLAHVLAEGESAIVLGVLPALGDEWQVEGPEPVLQMIRLEPLAVVDGPAMIQLTEAHNADMLALTAKVYPHYFRARTRGLGRYLGIYDGMVLAAMAGERMRLNGYQEISAVCTHPDYTGRGYAQRLVAELTNDILARGDVAFLHVSAANTRAKTLYERMGYTHRAKLPLWTVQRLPKHPEM